MCNQVREMKVNYSVIRLQTGSKRRASIRKDRSQEPRSNNKSNTEIKTWVATHILLHSIKNGNSVQLNNSTYPKNKKGVHTI